MSMDEACIAPQHDEDSDDGSFEFDSEFDRILPDIAGGFNCLLRISVSAEFHTS